MRTDAQGALPGRRGGVSSPPGTHTDRKGIAADVGAFLVVFLVAVPLSLGIAVASGAPLIAGIIAAIVGGIVAGLVGGSVVQVSGPAAGLTVIVADLVLTYGWRVTCLITLLAGLVQLALGAFRIARAALAVSPAVVHGMLAGVGVTIALAQLHVVLGGAPQSSALANIADLPRQIAQNHTAAVVIGVVTIAIMFGWNRLPAISGVRPGAIPAALIAVGTATVIAALGRWQVETVPDGRWWASWYMRDRARPEEAHPIGLLTAGAREYHASTAEALRRLAQANVVEQLDNLAEHPTVRARVESGELTLSGMYYDLESARVHLLDPATGDFGPLQGARDRPEPGPPRQPAESSSGASSRPSC